MESFLRKTIIPSFVICHLSFLIFLVGCGDVNSGVSTLTVSPPSLTIGVAQSQAFTVVAKDGTGKIVSSTPTWSLSGSIGTINSSSGLFIAGGTAGQGSVTATYSGKTATSIVSVTDLGWVAGRVVDNTGSRVQSIKVYLQENTSLLDFTDSDGDYSISDVPAGTYMAWTLATDAYRASSNEVTVASGETATANFTISYYTDPPDLTVPEL